MTEKTMNEGSTKAGGDTPLTRPRSGDVREWQASFHGIPIHTDPSLPHGTIEFRDRAGKVIGFIVDVGGVSIGAQR